MVTGSLLALRGHDSVLVDAPTMPGEFAVHHLRGGHARVDAPRLQALEEDTWALRGQVDMVNIRGFERAVAALPGAIRGTTLHMWVDQLEFIDVAGLGCLAGLAGRLPAGGRLVLHAPPARLVKMISLAFGPVPGLALSGVQPSDPERPGSSRRPGGGR